MTAVIALLYSGAMLATSTLFSSAMDPSDSSRTADALARPPPRTPQRWWALLVGFAVVFALLQWGWTASRGTALERAVVDEATVKPAVWLINLLTPATTASAEHSRILAPGGGINIRNGCEGTEVLFILGAAFIAAQLAWRTRLAGLAGGMVLVYTLNLVRILVLFYSFRADRGLFDSLHTTFAPLVMVLIVFLYFYAWLHHDRRTAAAA